MTAATVPPPGWIPIGAPEIRANSRRFFTAGFTISGAGHLAVLATLLWLRAGALVTEERRNEIPIHVIPPVVEPYPMPPVAPPAKAPGRAKTDNGPIVPTEDMKVNLPDPTKGIRPVAPWSKANGTSTPAPTLPADTTDRPDPGEGAFVPYDRPPIPYDRPAPSYPGWALEQRIEGRVVLHVLVGRDGRVKRITVQNDVPGLTDAAKEAVARWLFHPALSGKNAVAVWVEIPVDFKL